jgi:hypothetical protein
LQQVAFNLMKLRVIRQLLVAACPMDQRIQLMPGVEQLIYKVGAGESCTAGDKYAHLFSRAFLIGDYSLESGGRHFQV